MHATILAALEAAGRLTTRQLAVRLGADHATVYRTCRRMERDGVLVSELAKGASRVFFFPVTREVMGSNSFARIKRIDTRLRSVVGRYSLPTQRVELQGALEEEFQQLLETHSSHAAIEEFEEELLTAVQSATKKGDVTHYLGVRPMHPTARIWSIGRQLTLIGP